MSNVSIKGADSLQGAVDQILANSEVEILYASKDAAKKSADETVKFLKRNSRKKRGGYAKGWKATNDEYGYIVHNARLPGLTHLLENGHDIVVNGQKVGHYNGDGIIKIAEQYGIEDFEKLCKEEIERRLSK